MTRKDFELIARVIRESRKQGNNPSATVQTFDRIAERFAGYLRCLHPRFDANKFYAACQAEKDDQ